MKFAKQISPLLNFNFLLAQYQGGPRDQPDLTTQNGQQHVHSFFYVMYVFLDQPPLPRVSIGLVQSV